MKKFLSILVLGLLFCTTVSVANLLPKYCNQLVSNYQNLQICIDAGDNECIQSSLATINSLADTFKWEDSGLVALLICDLNANLEEEIGPWCPSLCEAKPLLDGCTMEQDSDAFNSCVKEADMILQAHAKEWNKWINYPAAYSKCRCGFTNMQTASSLSLTGNSERVLKVLDARICPPPLHGV